MATVRCQTGGVLKKINLGTGTSFNIKQLYPNDYQDLTVENFIIEAVSADAHGEGRCTAYKAGEVSHGTNAIATLVKSYSNGVLTIGGTTATKDSTGANDTGFVIANAKVTVTYKVIMLLGSIEV